MWRATVDSGSPRKKAPSPTANPSRIEVLPEPLSPIRRLNRSARDKERFSKQQKCRSYSVFILIVSLLMGVKGTRLDSKSSRVPFTPSRHLGLQSGTRIFLGELFQEFRPLVHVGHGH